MPFVAFPIAGDKDYADERLKRSAVLAPTSNVPHFPDALQDIHSSSHSTFKVQASLMLLDCVHGNDNKSYQWWEALLLRYNDKFIGLIAYRKRTMVLGDCSAVEHGNKDPDYISNCAIGTWNSPT